jgi:pimeloyl-ACP methyl ester carboxylesterase
MNRVEANDITITYDTFGPDGGEVILLISGLGTQMTRWPVPFCHELAALGHRVIRFDNRDAGLSTHFTDSPVPDFVALATAVARGQRPDVPYTLLDMAADAIALLDALSIERAHLVGRSMGGMIAQLMASEHPHRVLSLTSIMSSTGNPHLPQAAPDVMALLTKRAPHPVADEAGFLAHSVAFARRIASPVYPFDEELQRTLILAEVKRAYDPAGFGRQIAAIAATGDTRARLARITAPTLVVHGADDPLIPPACGEDTARSIRGAELMIIEGMGHDLPPELHRTVAGAIARSARRSSDRVDSQRQHGDRSEA